MRERLLDAAERLFATQGLDGTSIRDVNAAAGANPAAVHYHFGSKESLVMSALSRRSPAITAHRRALLDAIERDGSTDPRRAVEPIVLPLATVVATTSWGPSYVGLVAAFMGASPQWYSLRLRQHDERARVKAALARAAPGLSDVALEFRFEAIALLTTTTMARAQVDGTFAQRLHDDQGGVAEELVTCAAAILTAPPAGAAPRG